MSYHLENQLYVVLMQISNTQELVFTSGNSNFRILWGNCLLNLVIGLLKIHLCGLHYLQYNVKFTTATKCTRST